MPERKRITDPPKEPANQKLWDMLVIQAKRRFNKYPSLAASHWIHEQYVKEGGQFVSSRKEVDEGNKRESEKKDPRQGPHNSRLSKHQKRKLENALRDKKKHF